MTVAARGMLLGTVFAVLGCTGQVGRQTAGARSDDLRSWTCVADEPLLTAVDVPGSQGIHTFAASANADGEISLMIESLISGGSEIWLGEAVGLE